MPETIVLQDGTEREVPTAEEMADFQAKAQKAQKAEEFERKLAENATELEKLRNKDFNFKRLRDMSEAEKAKLSATEMELKRKAEELEESQKAFQGSIIEANKNEALAVLAGNDEEMKKKIIYNYNRITGEELTKAQINEKMRLAYNMLGQSSTSNPLSNMNLNGAPGYTPTVKQTPIDNELAGKLGITKEDMEKYDKAPNKGSTADSKGVGHGFQN